MAGIKKASFFISWFEVAETMSNDRALQFYKAIFNYYFYDVMPDADSSIREAFTLIKPNIDKDIQLKKGGRPKETEKPFKTINNGFNQPKNHFKTDVDVDVDVEEGSRKKEVDVKRIPPTFPHSFPQDFNILDFLDENGILLTKRTINKIEKRLIENDLHPSFIEFCFLKVKEQYPDSENINGAFVSAVLEWDNLLDEYRESIFDAERVTST